MNEVLTKIEVQMHICVFECVCASTGVMIQSDAPAEGRCQLLLSDRNGIG